jgi:hypothetical protein
MSKKTKEPPKRANHKGNIKFGKGKESQIQSVMISYPLGGLKVAHWEWAPSSICTLKKETQIESTFYLHIVKEKERETM